MGFIYVCDKENHRIQASVIMLNMLEGLLMPRFLLKVFQSDGTFVGKFGTCGSEEGQLVSQSSLE